MQRSKRYRRVNPATLNRLEKTNGGGFKIVYKWITYRFWDLPARRATAFARFRAMDMLDRDAFSVRLMMAVGDDPRFEDTLEVRERVWELLKELDPLPSYDGYRIEGKPLPEL